MSDAGPGVEPAAPLVPEVLPGWLEPARAALVDYAAILGGTAVEWGLLGPREVPRLWQRHLLNCLVVADPAEELVPSGATILDVGSGAGLPGLAWALARPDVRAILLEPLLRRSEFLRATVADLGVGDRVSVRRARAEDLAGDLQADVVTARAVAPLARLVGWAAPLTRPGGVILALKGASAAQEVARDRGALERSGIRDIDVLACGVGQVDPPTTVVRVRPARAGGTPPRGRRPRGDATHGPAGGTAGR